MPQLPEEDRWFIVLLSHSGFTIPEIRGAIGCDERTIENWLIRYAQTGNVKAMPRTGRRRVTTRDNDIDIIARSKADSFQTAVDILNDSGLDISVDTVIRRLKERGLKTFIAARKEQMTVLHKINRLYFANKFLNFNDWDRTISSDESTFVTGNPHSKIVWRAYGTRFEENNIQFIKNSGRSSVAVWGCMNINGLGPIHRINGNFNQHKYLDLMEILILPYINELYGNSYHYIQDRSPIHTTNMCREWFEQNLGQNNIYLPAKSPDMNVIEHIWYLIKRKLSNRGIFRNSEELWVAIRDEWEELRNDNNLMQNLVNSMRNRMQLIIQQEGNHTRY
jgi:transposase